VGRRGGEEGGGKRKREKTSGGEIELEKLTRCKSGRVRTVHRKGISPTPLCRSQLYHKQRPLPCTPYPRY
jgi:hypothetical protein